jgi:hypothetical protein
MALPKWQQAQKGPQRLARGYLSRRGVRPRPGRRGVAVACFNRPDDCVRKAAYRGALWAVLVRARDCNREARLVKFDARPSMGSGLRIQRQALYGFLAAKGPTAALCPADRSA